MVFRSFQKLQQDQSVPHHSPPNPHLLTSKTFKNKTLDAVRANIYAFHRLLTGKVYLSDAVSIELPSDAFPVERLHFSIILSTTGEGYPSDAVSIELLLDVTIASRLSNHASIHPAILTCPTQ